MSKYVAINGYCSTTKRPLGFQFERKVGEFVAVGSFSISSAGADLENEELKGKVYAGSNFRCKYCGNDSVIICFCGIPLCLKHEDDHMVCPKCGKSFNIILVNRDQLSDENIKSTKQ